MNTKQQQQPATLLPSYETLMAQAQVFASAWAIAGSKFDAGEGIKVANQEKANLAGMFLRLLTANDFLHAENESLRASFDTLRTGYDAARLEIESLKERVQQLGQLARDVNSRRVVELEAQLKAVGTGGDVQPYDQQAMGLCHVCGWKGVIDYPDGPVCVACEHDKQLAPQPTAQALHVAATSCPHEIDKDKIVLHFDSKQPGKNALAQLAARLQAAQAREDVPDMFWDADDTENFAHEIQDIIDGYGPGEIVTIECAKRLPNFRAVVTRDGDGISYEYLEAAIAAQKGNHD